jgi:hypothetical protein
MLYVLRYAIAKVAFFEDGLKTAVENAHLHGHLQKIFAGCITCSTDSRFFKSWRVPNFQTSRISW